MSKNNNKNNFYDNVVKAIYYISIILFVVAFLGFIKTCSNNNQNNNTPPTDDSSNIVISSMESNSSNQAGNGTTNSNSSTQDSSNTSSSIETSSSSDNGNNSSQSSSSSTEEIDKELHNIEIGQTGNASVSTNLTQAKEGDVVSIQIEVEDGYSVDRITVNGKDIDSLEFVMPDEDVVIDVYTSLKDEESAGYNYLQFNTLIYENNFEDNGVKMLANMTLNHVRYGFYFKHIIEDVLSFGICRTNAVPDGNDGFVGEYTIQYTLQEDIYYSLSYCDLPTFSFEYTSINKTENYNLYEAFYSLVTNDINSSDIRYNYYVDEAKLNDNMLTTSCHLLYPFGINSYLAVYFKVTDSFDLDIYQGNDKQVFFEMIQYRNKIYMKMLCNDVEDIYVYYYSNIREIKNNELICNSYSSNNFSEEIKNIYGVPTMINLTYTNDDIQDFSLNMTIHNAIQSKRNEVNSNEYENI